MVATSRGIRKQIMRFESVILIPILIIISIHTIQFVDQIRKPKRLMTCICAPGILCFVWRKGKGSMGRIALSYASVRATKVFLATFAARAINFKMIWQMHLRSAVATLVVGEPWAVPTWVTARPGIGMNRLAARRVALIVVVEADPNRTVAAASPRVEEAPTAICPHILAALRWVSRW